jgi:hypothetical protein
MMVDLLVNGVEPKRMLAMNEVTRSAEVGDWLKMSYPTPPADTVVELVSNSRAACAHSRIREYMPRRFAERRVR